MNDSQPLERAGFLDPVIRFCLEQKLIVALITLLLIGWGTAVAPFDWNIDWLQRLTSSVGGAVPVDAIPNLGENQQIVFTEWPGRSPQDVDDQITYPLSAALMGVPGVKEVRSESALGFSMIFLIFEQDVTWNASRTKVLEKLSSLPRDVLPEGVQPALGPDATALGQVYWYTLQGLDPAGQPTGGWDLHELRSVQDWQVRYGLLGTEGIAEIASIGGHVAEYQVDVDPDAMRAHDVTLAQVFDAVRRSNLDVGAGVTEINRVEYIVRGVGFITELADIEQAVVDVREGGVPIRVMDVATVARGPAPRRGVLTQGGAEVVGGVAVVTEGYNPLAAIENLKRQIAQVGAGLPRKAVVDWSRIDRAAVERFAAAAGFTAFAGDELDSEAWVTWLRQTPQAQWPSWVTLSQLEIVPFYDRTELIHETLGTLNDALLQQILVTVIVVLVMVMHLRSALVISAMLPLAVLMAFILMKLVGVDANVVALAGIAIAIGTIVDMGLIVTENVLRHLSEADESEPRIEVVFRGVREVASAVLTAISTTVVSFLPVFMLTGEAGKMFVPLAYTKTFVLIASVFIAITIVPAAVHLLMAGRVCAGALKRMLLTGLGAAAVIVALASLALGWGWAALAATGLLVVVLYHLVEDELPRIVSRLAPAHRDNAERFARTLKRAGGWLASVAAIVVVGIIMAQVWQPLGPVRGFARNLIFVTLLLGSLLAAFWLFLLAYGPLLRWMLAHKVLFLSVPTVMVLLGAVVGVGFDRVFSFVPAAVDRAGWQGDAVRLSAPWVWASHQFPGLGREFMPPLDEGSFLWMPTVSAHGSLGEILDVLQYQDRAIVAVPEVQNITGKIGRVDSALDPAPLSMVESIINYKSEYIIDAGGRPIHFQYDRERSEYVRDEQGELMPAASGGGRPFRQWRDHIRSSDDIWREIVAAADLPGVTTPPRLQPIETRLLMLRTGMRGTMGVKVHAPTLDALDRAALQIEAALREMPMINADTVTAERVVGKPYLEIHPDRAAIARHGLNIEDVQNVIATAIGGSTATTTVEDRERYAVRVRYPRELRQDIEQMRRIAVPAADGAQIPLEQLAEIRYVRGPEMMRRENTYLTGYVTFSAQPGLAEVDVVEKAARYLNEKEARGELIRPDGVTWAFAGNYQEQQRTMQTMQVVVPVALAIIFLILYLQFRSTVITLIVFSGIAVGWAGGLIMIHLYGQPWFANFDIFDVNMRELFQLHPINLSVAVLVGFLALFGIAVDDGVVMTSYLKQSFSSQRTESIQQIREATVAAGLRRVRPCLMTSATTILALLPVLTSTGRGSEIMIPMAIPSVGGMSLVLLTMFTVPVLYCLVEEIKWKATRAAAPANPAVAEAGESR